MSQYNDINIDPITFEVMRSVFEFASDRMATVLQRSSFSPILADMLDFSNAIYDADLQLLSQAANCPVHLAAMKFSAEEALKECTNEVLGKLEVGWQAPLSSGTAMGGTGFSLAYFAKVRKLVSFRLM